MEEASQFLKSLSLEVALRTSLSCLTAELQGEGWRVDMTGNVASLGSCCLPTVLQWPWKRTFMLGAAVSASETIVKTELGNWRR